MEASELVKSKIVGCITEKKNILRLPLVQRAKFEGWLKIELAYSLEQDKHATEVRLEESYGGKNRSDISFSVGGRRYHAFLSTANTNWRTEGIEIRGRPITRNITHFINDILRSRTIKPPDTGLAVMLLFPVPKDVVVGPSSTLRDHESRIEAEAKLKDGSLQGTFVPVSGSVGILVYVVGA